MTLAIAGILVPVVALVVWIAIKRARARSIAGIPGRNRHFASLAGKLHLQPRSDDYFLQLEGTWDARRIVLFPHNFEGPGSITILIAETNLVLRDRTWVEPSLTLGRALVEWRRGNPFGCEFAGELIFDETQLTSALAKMKQNYPFAAVTLPSRYLLSPLLVQSLGAWRNFIAVLAMDSGRTPSLQQLQKALDDACALAAVAESSVCR